MCASMPARPEETRPDSMLRAISSSQAASNPPADFVEEWVGNPSMTGHDHAPQR